MDLKKVWVEEKDEKMLELYLSKIDLLLKKAEASNKSKMILFTLEVCNRHLHNIKFSVE